MSAPTPELIGYRFRTVELDLPRACLRVDGVELLTTPLPMKLLTLLCERAGTLCTRDQIFEAVWPRQDISDDALNKLISRLRELLGPHAEVIVTVRKQGLRLDAPVQRLLREPAPIDPPVAVSVAATEAAPPPSAPRPRWPSMVALGLLVLVALAALYWRPGSSPGAAGVAGDDRLVFVSYALRESDLRAGHAQTAELVRGAERALDAGDSAQARRLLESAERSDSSSALLPALRAILRGSDERDSEAELVARARARLLPQDSPYARLLIDYAGAGADGPQAERALVDALLTLRPQAWRLRLRRAHLDIQTGNRQGALRHLRAIPIDQAPVPTLMFVLADRVSYGDAEAVEAALAAGALAQAPLQLGYVRARLAWSQRAADTGALLEALADSAESAGSFSLANHARELAAAYAYAVADAQADARLRRAAYALKEAGRAENAAPLLALAAELSADAGKEAEARALLQQALPLVPSAEARVEMEILNARLGLLPRGSFLETAGGTDDRFGRGEPALIAAWYAWKTGARAQARAALDEARAGGIAGSPRAESAALLGVELGEPASDCWLDPPYPDLLRLSACRRLRLAHLTATGAPD